MRRAKRDEVHYDVNGRAFTQAEWDALTQEARDEIDKCVDVRLKKWLTQQGVIPKERSEETQ